MKHDVTLAEKQKEWSENDQIQEVFENLFDIELVKKMYHVTYYLENKTTPTLSGMTLAADNIVQAIMLWVDVTEMDVTKIKYAIEM